MGVSYKSLEWLWRPRYSSSNGDITDQSEILSARTAYGKHDTHDNKMKYVGKTIIASTL